jgi:threonine/homoserine/homoserine lactone efflux protein
MLIALGMGMSTGFARYPQIHLLIKILGISYLLYLAWKIATTQTRPDLVEKSKPLSFIQATFFQWVNPKAWVMAVSAIAAFTTTGSELYTQTLIIALVVMLVGFPCVGVWMGFGVWLRTPLFELAQINTP